MKYCNVCKEEKNMKEFHKRTRSKDSLAATCKECSKKIVKEWNAKNPDKSRAIKVRYSRAHIIENKIREHAWRKNKPGMKNAKEARRRAIMLRAFVPGQKEAIRKIYEKCPSGFHVDHIVPLKGKNVSGLHASWNLQYLPAIENMKKGNRYANR